MCSAARFGGHGWVGFQPWPTVDVREKSTDHMSTTWNGLIYKKRFCAFLRFNCLTWCSPVVMISNQIWRSYFDATSRLTFLKKRGDGLNPQDRNWYFEANMEEWSFWMEHEAGVQSSTARLWYKSCWKLRDYDSSLGDLWVLSGCLTNATNSPLLVKLAPPVWRI